MNYKIQFVELRNLRYIYSINGTEIDLTEKLAEIDIKQRIDYINKCLKNYVDFRDTKIDIPLREFLLLGYLFFNSELSEYLIYFIQKLILDTEKKKLTEVLILKYVFNANITEVQYSIHNSTDKSEQMYNDKIKEFINQQIAIAKKHLIGHLLLNKDMILISRLIKLITLNSFLQICSNYFLDDAINYFDFVIREVLLPTKIRLSLNGIISTATGLSHKETKDSKNLFKSNEKENLYREILCLAEKYNSSFYIFKEEAKYLCDIENALISFKKLNEDKLSELMPNRILMICMEMFKEKFSLYLKHISRSLQQKNIIINRTNAIMEMFLGINEQKANHIYTYYKMNDKNSMLEDFIKDDFINKINLHDKTVINVNDDLWILYWRIKENVRKISVNFTGLNSDLLKNEIKQFYRFIIMEDYKNKAEGDGVSEIISSTNLVIRSINYLQMNFNIYSANEIKLIHIYKLIKYLQNDYRSKNNKRIKVSTIVKCISHLRTFIDWLIGTNSHGLSKPLNNPFQYVVFKGVYNKNTEVIPECVIEGILTHLNELRVDIQRMVLIMLNCGLRFKEVAYLEEDCVSESNDEYKILKYIPYKVLGARRRNGLDDYHRIIIDDELYHEINEQIEYTSNLREKYSSSEIFLVTGINDNLCMIDSTTFCNAVQKLINKFNITGEEGVLWNITSKQYRKTLAVDMITKGNANEYEVGSYLGHLNVNTTKKFYAEVRKKKLADMNSEFFKKKFQLSIDEKHLEEFSEEERKLLYVDFCLNTRDVEYGVCTRAFSIDNCNRRGDIFGCATCSKICTGKKYYKRWTGLYENQELRVETLIKIYKSEGISKEEYQKFREYEREKYLLDSFKVIIDKLKGDYGDGD